MISVLARCDINVEKAFDFEEGKEAQLAGFFHFILQTRGAMF